MSFFKPIAPMTMQDVLEWTIAHNKDDYVNPVKKCEERYDHRALSDIPADLDDFHKRFPLKGYKPGLGRTEEAYKAWRRKVQAAIKGASGQLAEEQERRARQDAWADLIDALEPLTGMPEEAMYPHQVLIPIRKLADLARQHGKEPSHVSQEWLTTLRSQVSANEWASLQNALCRLNHFRYLSSVQSLLPAEPFTEPKVLRDNVLPGVPDHISEEIKEWVETSTRGEYDPVEERYEQGTSEADIAQKTAALRKFVSTLSECIPISTDQQLRDLLTPDNATLVVRKWTINTDGHGKITARTAHDYLKAIRVVMARNGLSPDKLKEHLKTNRFLREGKEQGKKMSTRARTFCETLLGSQKRTLTFLSLHVQLRNTTENLLAEYTACCRNLPQREMEKVRALGSVAAICALETRGAPLRIDNALSLRFRGNDITFHLPTAMTDHATITLSPEHTKNDNEVWAPIERGNLNGLEVIEWYMEKIRPLYPHADASDFLFPGIEASRHLPYETFLGWFKRETRDAGLPMTPHNFRHGLASLLIEANPGRWDLLERLLDDTVGTARRNYGWVNKRTQRSEVQKYVLDLTRLKA
ncbi:tyrosine-type recombinase/integrase [Ruegeria sp. R13_0]|uniref:tyrosine-type recombinase/integrase n=1 Tax=Ruegeria sp. R13_0 TaxID=2821099 RepID=UPI001AD9DCA1|nr:tyrosine-type recombinase/integrase [Ruegeria sp. R13_0]MBO9436473.1 tyrosine-type recombinase/integrase [Ruegeria sp. R13_0]